MSISRNICPFTYIILKKIIIYEKTDSNSAYKVNNKNSHEVINTACFEPLQVINPYYFTAKI